MLPHLSEIAHTASEESDVFVKYIPACRHFCDGYAVQVTNVEVGLVSSHKESLTNFIQCRLIDLSIKHLTISKRGANVHIWFTFTPESAFVRSRTIFEIRDIEKAVGRYAKLHWEVQDEESVTVFPSKVDIARDMRGAFFPHADGQV